MALDRPIPVKFDNRSGNSSGWATLRNITQQLSISYKVVIGPRELLYPGATPNPIPEEAWINKNDDLMLCKIFVDAADIATVHAVLDSTTGILNQPNQDHGGRQEETLPSNMNFEGLEGVLSGNITLSSWTAANLEDNYLRMGMFKATGVATTQQNMVPLGRNWSKGEPTTTTTGGQYGLDDSEPPALDPGQDHDVFWFRVQADNPADSLVDLVIAANAIVHNNGGLTMPAGALTFATPLTGVRFFDFYYWLDVNGDLFLATELRNGQVVAAYDYNTAQKNGKANA